MLDEASAVRFHLEVSGAASFVVVASMEVVFTAVGSVDKLRRHNLGSTLLQVGSRKLTVTPGKSAPAGVGPLGMCLMHQLWQ